MEMNALDVHLAASPDMRINPTVQHAHCIKPPLHPQLNTCTFLHQHLDSAAMRKFPFISLLLLMFFFFSYDTNANASSVTSTHVN